MKTLIIAISSAIAAIAGLLREYLGRPAKIRRIVKERNEVTDELKKAIAVGDILRHNKLLAKLHRLRREYHRLSR